MNKMVQKVGGHWPLWRGWKKTNDHAEPTKKVECLTNDHLNNNFIY